MPLLTDPTYLRYIFDGLESQSIHKDNISALPAGLIGVYEESLPQEHNVQEREMFLSFFSAWALLKKDVSAPLISNLLNWNEQEVIDYISNYTKWFNSPNSGTYILYHERLRVFLLEKISSQQLQITNEKIISLCQIALEQRKGDEWEIYALEHLPAHLHILAMQDEQEGAVFKKLVYHTGYWNRQVEISKGFDWSKKMLNLAMGWAAKQNTDELIECALNKVDLHYMEQNDAPRIVELVAQNDIETALQRIEAFGGSDKEGLQRKFTLYMLCLMELTLLDSKNKPFSKEAILKVLTHLEYNFRSYDYALNWNDFFSSYLMFLMACEWNEMNINYLLVYEISTCEVWGKGYWEEDWISKNGPYTHDQFEVLYHCANVMKNKWGKSNILFSISTELAKQGFIHRAHECLNEISDDYLRAKTIYAISNELAIQGNFSESQKYASSIMDDFYKSKALVSISSVLFKKGNEIESKRLMKDALVKARSIIYNIQKSYILAFISSELAIQGEFAESTNILKEALQYANSVTDEVYEKDELLIAILNEMGKQGKFEDALSFVSSINDEFNKCLALLGLWTEFSKQGKIKESEILLQKLVLEAQSINNKLDECNFHCKISREMFRQGRSKDACSFLEEALDIVNNIIDFGENRTFRESEFFKNICSELTFQHKQHDASLLLKSMLISKIGALSDAYKSIHCIKLSRILAKLGQGEKASTVMHRSIIFNQSINDYKSKNSIHLEICIELVNQLKLTEALECAHNNSDKRQKSAALRIISIQLARLGKYEEASFIMQEAIVIVRDIENDRSRNASLRLICHELVNQLKVDEALLITRGIEDDVWKTVIIVSISGELYKKGHLVIAKNLLQEAINCFQLINEDNSYKNFAQKEIACVQAQQGFMVEAIVSANRILDYFWKSQALSNISIELAKQGKFNESFACVSKVNDDLVKLQTLSDISIELGRQGNFILAEKTGLEIPQIATRQKCWFEIAKQQKEQFGCDLAFKNISNFQSQEAQIYYLKGWAESISVDDISNELAHQAIHALMNDSSSLEHFLQVFAQHEIFFNNPSQEKIDRLNKTLNLQWALDIIAQFHKE